jgi:hypothetical protein
MACILKENVISQYPLRARGNTIQQTQHITNSYIKYTTQNQKPHYITQQKTYADRNVY